MKKKGNTINRHCRKADREKNMLNNEFSGTQ